MTWYVRRASLHDKDALVALCEAAVGPDDYVIERLDDLILRSVVHVAIAGWDRIVGMMSYRPCIDGSAWLGQARTHPDFRRQGVARAIMENFVGVARASRVSALRLWSEATNAEGLAAPTTAGFREVARFGRLVGPAARGATRASPAAFDESLWGLVAASPIITRGKGYVHHDSAFVPATRPVVFAIASRGSFRAWKDNLISVAVDARHRETLEVTMWAGRPPELLEEVCRQAAAAGCSETEVFLPHDRDLLAEARRVGFQEGTWGGEVVLLELPVVSAPLRKRVRPTYGELYAKRAGHGHDHGDDNALGWARWNG
jgi:GNAT superfamily N-acetyltransferase